MPAPWYTPHDTAGATVLTLGFGGTTSTYIVTNITLGNTNPAEQAEAKINIAHLGQTVGETELRLDRPLTIPAEDGSTGRNVTFDYIGKTVLHDGVTGTYHIQVASSTLVGGTTASYYTVSSSTLTLAVNDVIRGQATLSVAR